MTSLTKEAVAHLGVKPRDAERSKNLFALGLVSWMYTRPVEPTLTWIESRFSSKPLVRDANIAAFKAGHAFGETAELFDHPFEVQPAQLPSGTYTNINGNTALAWGLIAAGQLSGLPLFLGSYPITPASDILHELSRYKNFGIRTLQAEDEIAGIGSALGAAFGGHLGITTTSGPGIALKGETMGLAVSLELPLLIIDVQRGGPSTGLPTKTEAADLLHGHVRPPRRVADPDRGRLQPVALLRRGDRGGPHRPQVPHAGDGPVRRLPGQRLRAVAAARARGPARHLGGRSPPSRTTPTPTATRSSGPTSATRSRWPVRGPSPAPPTSCTASVASRRRTAPATSPTTRPTTSAWSTCGPRRSPASPTTSRSCEVEGDDDADILVLGWGSTWGAISGAVDRCRAKGKKVARAHLVHLNPFPRNLGEVLHRFPRVLVPEMNLGQLSKLVRAEYLVDAHSVTKVRGVPFTAGELEAAILKELGD